MVSKIKTLLFVLFSFFFVESQAQNYWQKVEENSLTAKQKDNILLPSDYSVFELNTKTLKEVLSNAPLRSSEAKSKGVTVFFPAANGSLKPFKVFEAPVLDKTLSEKYPNIKSYAGQGIEDKTEHIRFSISHLGLKNMLFSATNGFEFTEPYSADLNQYYVYQRKDRHRDEFHFECTLEDALHPKAVDHATKDNADDGTLRTFRLAASTTGEYADYFGGTVADALAAINTSMTRVNGIYEVDFNVTMILISNTDDVIYTDSATDPYSNNSGPWNGQLQSTLTAEIGEANYDVGHLFAQGPNSGNAGCIGCVCVDNNKGSGWTSLAIPEGDPFDVDYLSHELGHQFGGNHTWTHGGNEGTNVQMEPGSGSTIMGYAGITGNTDVQSNSDPYFHAVSIEQITDYVKSTSCQTEDATGNTVPTVDAGLDYTIPSGTPFTLSGTGTDPDEDALTFCWEQMDENNANTTFPSVTATSGVAFRSLNPTTSNERTFPEISTVLMGLTATTWEAIPNVGRSLNFRLTVRDNVAGGGTNESDNMVVTVNGGTGPFMVTVPNTNLDWSEGTTKTITWDVAGTDGAPINTSNVNILLSTDGGNNFDITIAANTPNDGSYDFIVPNNIGTTNRIKIEAVGNIYFDISDTDFTISGFVPCAGTTPTNLSADVVTDVTASLSWDAVAGADTYDLRYREIGTASWTTISVAANSTTISGLTQLTDYEVQVRTVCPDNSVSAYSSSVNFTTMEEVLEYCDSNGNNTSDEYISNVLLGSIDNTTGASPGGYGDYINLSTDLTIDATATIEITPTWTGTVYDEGYSVWIDYNKDGDFDDAGEQVFTEAPTNATPVIGSFIVPSDATLGSTRMRVSMKYNDIPGPCEIFTWGEVEDYSINIVADDPCTTLDFNDGEVGWGIWNDGGADAALTNDATVANSGNFSFLIKDNTSTSNITTGNLDLSGSAEFTLDFNFLAKGFNSNTQDFWLQISDDGGASFSTIETWKYVDDFVNNTRVFESIFVEGPFTSTTQIRFQCDATGNNDKVYIDDILIDNCTSSTASCSDLIQNQGETEVDCGGPNCGPCIGCFSQDFNDIEASLGVWVDGGVDARRNNLDEAFANSGIYCVRLQDDTDESTITTTDFDLSAYDYINIDFSYITSSMEAGEGFLVQYSTDGGVTFTDFGSWVLNDDFMNGVREDAAASVVGPFTATTQVRIRCNGSNNNDRVYIDDINIDGCYDATGIDSEIEMDIRSIDLTKVNFNLRPNPVQTSETIVLDIQSTDDSVKLQVFDLYGKVILNQTVQNLDYDNYRLQTPILSEGTYFIKVGNSSNFEVKKFVVIR